MKEKFFVFAIGCSTPDSHYDSMEKASEALMKKAKELNGRWNTHDLKYEYDEDSVVVGFTISSGGWDDHLVSWRLIKIPVY